MYYYVSGTKLRLVGTIHRFPPDGKVPGWFDDSVRWAEVAYMEHDIWADSEEREMPWSLAISKSPMLVGSIDGAEHHLRKTKKPLFLETLAELHAVMKEVPVECIENSVMRMTPEHLVDAFEVWRTRKELMSLDETPAALKVAMFDARNAMWLPKIISLTKSKKNTCVYVGDGHLHGLKSELEQAGFTVKSIPLPYVSL